MLCWHPLQMAELPLDPPLARMLLASGEMGCTAEVLTVVAMLRCGAGLAQTSSRSWGSRKAAAIAGWAG